MLKMRLVSIKEGKTTLNLIIEMDDTGCHSYFPTFSFVKFLTRQVTSRLVPNKDADFLRFPSWNLSRKRIRIE